MKSLLVCVFAVLIIFSSSAMAQGNPSEGFAELVLSLFNTEYFSVAYPLGRDIVGGGARAKGMGNAFLGISDDITAVSWNPAGLYIKDNPYEQPVLGLSYRNFSANGDFTLQDRKRGDQLFSADDVFGGIDMVSFLAPIRMKGHPFVISASYTRLDDEFYNGGLAFDTLVPYTLDDVEQNIGHPFHAAYESEYHSALDAINFGFGTRLYDKLSFGFAINIYSGKSTSMQHFNFILDGVVLDFTAQRVKQEIDSLVVDSINYSGVYFTGGLRYGGERFSAGLVIRAPHVLKQTRDRAIRTGEMRNDHEIDDENEVFFFEDDLLELDQPLVIGVGVGYKATEQLLLAADIEYRAFSSGEIRVRDSISLVPGDRDIEYYTTFDPKWNSVLTVRFGTEYIWQTGSSLVSQIPIRAGFGYVPIPEPDIDDGSVTSSAAITRFSFGTGARWEQIHLDFAFVHSSLDRDNVVMNQTSSNTNDTYSVTFTGYF